MEMQVPLQRAPGYGVNLHEFTQPADVFKGRSRWRRRAFEGCVR